jgi:signal transduction histidine kinase/CheY-like chemotaxis protein
MTYANHWRLFRGAAEGRGILFHRIVMLFCMAVFLLLSGVLSGAEKKERKVVRIPVFPFERMMILDEDNNPMSGYAYEYIQTIAAYAGWDIEYIPCDSFSECLNKLFAGEADLFYEISHTEERAKTILFPDEPMGHEYYYLYALKGNTSISPDDFASLNGKKVGVTRGTMQIELLKQWCEKKNVDFKIIEYEFEQQKESDLYAGKIDLDLEVSILAKHDFSAVERIGSSAYYLVANKERTDLIDDINSTMGKILNNDLYYFTRLQERYLSDTVISLNLTTEEKNWIADHKVLRVGFFDNYLPFSTLDKSGNPAGAGIEAIREIIKKLNLEDELQVEFICYFNQEEGYKAVESEEIDLMLPAYISNSVKHDYHIIGGKIISTLVSDLAFLNDFGDGAGKRIGVNKNNMMQFYYSRDCYPHAQIVFYDDIRGCLDGLLKGTSDGTFLNGLRTEALLRPKKYHSLKTERARNGFEFHMAFAADNIGLMLLMDRGLTMLDPDFMNKASYSYAGRIYTFSVMDFLREHILVVLCTVAFLGALTMALIGSQISKRKLAGINRELKENAEELRQNAEELRQNAEELRQNAETIEKQRLQEVELRKQLEDALQMAQAASHAKTAFLSNMSHDIRTPMNAIIGFTGLAASHIDDKERVQDYLKTIERSSEHLLSLINDVLDMSRIESGKMNLNEKVESLADILHSLRDIVHADIYAKQHNLFIDTVDVRNERVYCDKLRLNQVLLNLVSNAIKYTHPGGAISLRVIQKSVTDKGYATFEFRCKDNGIGMSEEFAKTIFDPFTREETTTVSGIQGTGLGMAITKNIVEMMGGKITVNSKKGEGTEFVVTVSFRIADKKTSDPVIPELKGLRSLVVDDDINACQSIADMLREVGMRSEWCVSGKEAVIRTEESLRHGDRFKVYFIDWMMPDMNGIESVRRIRRIVGKDVFIIIMTACDWTDIEKDAREAGVNGFISKPLFPSDLQKTLRQLCGKEDPEQTEKEELFVSLKGKKVLLVDDNELNLKIGVLQLKQHGMTVDTALNGQLAVDMIRANGINAYDFVLMDIQMPVMNGYEATSIIRKLPGGNKLKILAFSANAFEEDKEKSLKAGLDGHIAKPLKVDELLSELKRFKV